MDSSGVNDSTSGAMDVSTLDFPSVPSPDDFRCKTIAGKTNDVLMDNMDSLLNKELYQLSPKDREEINEEIHGVHSMHVPETPELIVSKLAEMDRQLTNVNQHQLPIHTQNAYEEALAIGSPYIHDPNFRIMFLRAELFDTAKAANRMMGFLQLLRDYLGPQALLQLPYSSLNQMTAQEIQLLKRSVFVLLPGRDGAGRRISGYFNDAGEFPVVCKIKVCLYVFMAAAEDIVTQQKGIVEVVYQCNQSTIAFIDREERIVISRLLSFIPLRMSCAHICLPPSPIFELIKRLALAAANNQIRARCRFHTGSPTEILYSLQSFGISPSQMPINSITGEVKDQPSVKWVAMRRAMEAARAVARTRFNGIECPTHQDVLSGRGQPIISHRGNVNMRLAVQSRMEQFCNAKHKEAREKIIYEVVQETYQIGGQFLKEDPGRNGWWVPVDEDAALQKVGFYFRDLKRHTKVAKAQEPKNNVSSNLRMPSTLKLPKPWLQRESSTSDNDHKPLIAATTPKARRQELESSTYEFLEASSRDHKRYKQSKCDGFCGGFFGS